MRRQKFSSAEKQFVFRRNPSHVHCMSRPLKEFLQRWIITTVSVLVAAQVVPKIHYDNWRALLIATLVLGLLNAFIKPILFFVSLPLLILTLGLFTLVINAVLLYFVANLVKGFHVDSFGSALVGALIVSLMTIALNSLTRSGNSRIEIHRGKPRPPNKPDSGDGPIIDV
jgi:putative membrane protein